MSITKPNWLQSIQTTFVLLVYDVQEKKNHRTLYPCLIRQRIKSCRTEREVKRSLLCRKEVDACGFNRGILLCQINAHSLCGEVITRLTRMMAGYSFSEWFTVCSMGDFGLMATLVTKRVESLLSNHLLTHTKYPE